MHFLGLAHKYIRIRLYHFQYELLEGGGGGVHVWWNEKYPMIVRVKRDWNLKSLLKKWK